MEPVLPPLIWSDFFRNQEFAAGQWQSFAQAWKRLNKLNQWDSLRWMTFSGKSSHISSQGASTQAWGIHIKCFLNCSGDLTSARKSIAWLMHPCNFFKAALLWVCCFLWCLGYYFTNSGSPRSCLGSTVSLGSDELVAVSQEEGSSTQLDCIRQEVYILLRR